MAPASHAFTAPAWLTIFCLCSFMESLNLAGALFKAHLIDAGCAQAGALLGTISELPQAHLAGLHLQHLHAHDARLAGHERTHMQQPSLQDMQF